MEKELQYRIERVIQVAHNRGIDEMGCKRCGCITPVEGLTYVCRGKKHIVAECTECGSFIRFMAQDSLPRVYDFNRKDMIYVTDADAPLLEYHLSNTKSQELKNAIREELERRFVLSMNDYEEKRKQLRLFE